MSISTAALPQSLLQSRSLVLDRCGHWGHIDVTQTLTATLHPLSAPIIDNENLARGNTDLTKFLLSGYVIPNQGRIPPTSTPPRPFSSPTHGTRSSRSSSVMATPYLSQSCRLISYFTSLIYPSAPPIRGNFPTHLSTTIKSERDLPQPITDNPGLRLRHPQPVFEPQHPRPRTLQLTPPLRAPFFLLLCGHPHRCYIVRVPAARPTLPIRASPCWRPCIMGRRGRG